MWKRAEVVGKSLHDQLYVTSFSCVNNWTNYYGTNFLLFTILSLLKHDKMDSKNAYNFRPSFTKNATWASAPRLFRSRTRTILYYLFNCYNCPLIMCILVFYHYLFYSVMDQFRRIHHHWFIDIAHVTTILNSYTWITCTAILIIIIVIKLYIMLSLQNKVILYFS